jgi:hypothetical protein
MLLAPAKARRAVRSELNQRLGPLGYRKSLAPDAWVRPLGAERDGFHAVHIDIVSIYRIAYVLNPDPVTRSITVRTWAGRVAEDDPYLSGSIPFGGPMLSTILRDGEAGFVAASRQAVRQAYESVGIAYDAEVERLVEKMHDQVTATPFAITREADIRTWSNLVIPAVEASCAELLPQP